MLTKTDLARHADFVSGTARLGAVATSSKTGAGLTLCASNCGWPCRPAAPAAATWCPARPSAAVSRWLWRPSVLPGRRSLPATAAARSWWRPRSRVALEELGRVAGAVYTDDVLDRIFSRFCIGK